MNTYASILARNQHGDEFHLEVREQHQLVVLRDTTFIRVMSQRHAVELAGALLLAARPDAVTAVLTAVM
jgi:hypothetical protein